MIQRPPPITHDLVAQGPGQAAPGKPAAPRMGAYLWKIIRDTHPSLYAQEIAQGIAEGVFVADQAINFPLAQSMEKHLIQLPHEPDHAPEMTRDQRLTAWFQACVDCGANPKQSVARLGMHAAGGFARLMQMKALGTLAWWQAQGVDGHIPAPTTLAVGPTTLATIAFLYAHPTLVETLTAQGAGLTHTDQLWHLVWSNRCANKSRLLLDQLWAVSTPPTDALRGLAQARVNKKNIYQVMATAQALVDAGCDLYCEPAGSLPALGRAITHADSPQVVTLVKFFLAQGADPLAKAKLNAHLGQMLPTRELTMVELALERFMGCAVKSQLREPLLACFELLARACPVQAINELYPGERQEQILGELRAKTLPPSSGFAPASAWNADAEAARLQALWMDILVATPAVGTRARARI